MVRKWIGFVARRFAKVDRTGRTRATAILSAGGIGFGVAALIVIMAVMNGFQMGYIESIMELSSFHLRATPEGGVAGVAVTPEDGAASMPDFAAVSGVRSTFPLYEAETLLAGRNGRQSPALLRGLPEDITGLDEGFESQLFLTSGDYNTRELNTVVLGSSLARSLGVRIGDQVTLLVLSGGAGTDLFQSDRMLTVTGVFSCSYNDINASFAFVSLETARALLGDSAPLVYGIKLRNSADVDRVLHRLEREVPGFSYETWRNYNASFFGALKVEKNLLLLTAALIFVVVGVNIFNAMRRMVYQKHEEIAVLKAFGATRLQVQTVFVLQGLRTGLAGSLPGLVAGLLIANNLEGIVGAFSQAVYFFQYIFTRVFAPQNLAYLRGTSVFLYYAGIPARPFFSETALITVFGVVSSFAAAWAASRTVLNMSVAEVLHDE